ncbi:uncharacterized protein LOC127720645 isoform X2 [Mytilus californianus]|uniref:uncharacterized protein LOC127720645 isoform X2 n=1 Tax=Mytilus californianus TaxID=6549 RepID=UPI00224815CD|nr:uncharacterized protein LOC127720645 isoform X2 [Mytilus californianus]
MKRAQVQVIEKKARALHMKDHKVFSKSMEKDCHKTMEEIQKLKTIVDNIDILIKVFGKSEDVNTLLVNEDIQRVPVFLQLDLPASWNRTKVLEYLDEMRINGTSDMNIKIMAVSPDDLNIYSEIAKTVLNKVDLLKDEVQKLLSGMLLEAAIDPKQSAEVGFSLTIPKITEETSEINSEDEHDEAEQADHPSAIDDCQTRTEFDEPVRLKSYFKFDISRRQKLQLEAIQNSLISDCVITNDQLVFTDYFNNILHIYNINGSHNRDIRLSNHPKCISVIKDTDVAVSYNRDIEIIDINTGELKNTIVTRGVTSGISYQNGLMYVVICHQKIDVMKMTGEIVRSIHCPFQSLYISLSTDTDSLLLTDSLTLTVYCCDLYGSVRWKFTNDKMHMPTGVTKDGNGNVYVVCNESNNVVVVSPDGKHHKELLTKKDGLQKPTGIYYDKSNDCLLVCNGGNCDAFLFDVKHSTKNE